MSVAVLSPQGQLTIPADILRKLGLRGGDKVVLAEQGNDVIIRKSNIAVWEEFQEGMDGAAAEAGFGCEQDVVDYCKEIRREIWEERYANHA